MPEDNLCDTCKKPMSIKRSGKNSRYLTCENPNCPRKVRKAAKSAPAAQPPASKGSPKSAEANTPPAAAKRSFFSLR